MEKFQLIILCYLKHCIFEVDAEGDGAADESFGSVGADDGKAGTGGGKLTLKLLLDHGLIEVDFCNDKFFA